MSKVIDKQIYEVAILLGCAQEDISPGSIFDWHVSPGDDALSASIEVRENSLRASIVLSYLNHPCVVIDISVEDGAVSIGGVLGCKEKESYQLSDPGVLDAISTFNTHRSEMGSGPFINKLNGYHDVVFDGSQQGQEVAA